MTVSSCGEPADVRKERHIRVASEVAEIVSSAQNPKWDISVLDVERPKTDWCLAAAISVRSCASARPKKDLYWLEITCAGRPAYIATYDRAFPDSLLLQSVNAEHACYKNK